MSGSAAALESVASYCRSHRIATIKVAGLCVICCLPSRVSGSGVNARKAIGAVTTYGASLLAA